MTYSLRNIVFLLEVNLENSQMYILISIHMDLVIYNRICDG